MSQTQTGRRRIRASTRRKNEQLQLRRTARRGVDPSEQPPAHIHETRDDRHQDDDASEKDQDNRSCRVSRYPLVYPLSELLEGFGVVEELQVTDEVDGNAQADARDGDLSGDFRQHLVFQ
jgi:hypothetical protein